MTTKVGAVDGDALISKLEEWKMKAAMWAGKESKVAVGEKQTCEVLIRLMHEGRFALKPEASQETLERKSNAQLQAIKIFAKALGDGPQHEISTRFLKMLAELEDAE